METQGGAGGAVGDGDVDGGDISAALPHAEGSTAPVTPLIDEPITGDDTFGTESKSGGTPRLPTFFDFNPDEYALQLRAKVDGVRRLFAGLLDLGASGDDHSWDEPGGAGPAAGRPRPAVPLTIVPSPVTGHRMRCRFAVLKDPSDGRLRLAMWDGGRPVALDDVQGFPMAAVAIQRLMSLLLRELNAQRMPSETTATRSTPSVFTLTAEVLRESLDAVTFLCTHASPTDGGGALVTLVYGGGRELDSEWMAAATDLRRRLGGEEAGLHVVGRSRGSCVALDSTKITDAFTLRDGRVVRHNKTDGVFSNPNAVVGAKSLDWLCDRATAIAKSFSERGVEMGPLLELFSGACHHTVALASVFRRVTAVEISGRLCVLGRENCALNGLRCSEGVCSKRGTAAEWTSGADGETIDADVVVIQCPAERICKRIAASSRAGHPFSYSCMLVDPPRRGLDAVTMAAARTMPHVLYVACDPAALRRDMELLAATHDVGAFACFDHFPFTRHFECAAHFIRR